MLPAQALAVLAPTCQHAGHVSLQGLLLLRNGSSQVELVSSRVSNTSPLAPGSPIIYANDLDIASDGMVYFTSSVDIVLHRWGSTKGTAECSAQAVHVLLAH
jgi:sugar lactone lactonase YvrE